MRRPLDGVFAAEPASRRWLLVLAAAFAAVDSGALTLFATRYFVPFLTSKIFEDESRPWGFGDAILLSIEVSMLMLAIVMSNVCMAFFCLMVVNSPVMRVLLRWLIHALVWVFLAVLASVVCVAIFIY